MALKKGSLPNASFLRATPLAGTTSIARRGAVVAGSGLLLASLAAFTVGAQSASSAVSFQNIAGNPKCADIDGAETGPSRDDNNIVQILAVERVHAR